MSDYPRTQDYEHRAIDILANQVDVDSDASFLAGQHLVDLIAHALKYADLSDDVASHQLIDIAHADFDEFVDGKEVIL